MILRRTAATALTAGCLALAACSSSGDDPTSGSPSGPGAASTPSTASSTVSSGASSSSPSPAADADLAAIGVQRSEVPSSFTAQAPDADDDDADDAKVLACIGAKSTKADEQATAKSQDFSTETASVSSEVTRFGSQASVESDSAIFGNPKVKDCFTSQLQQVASEGPAGAKIVSTDVDVTAGSDGGPSNVAGTVSGTLVLEAEGKRVPVYITSVYITGPKLEVQVTFSGFGTQFDSTLAKTVATAVAKRAAAA